MQVNQSSMLAHANFLSAAAHNVANVNTESFGALDTTLGNSAGGNVVASTTPSPNPTSLQRELTDQITIENGFDAQVRSIQAKDDMVGSLLDVRG